MYLLDTNCLSELRRIRTGRADPNVAAWVATVPLRSMYLSVLSIFELQAGIARVTVRDPNKAKSLQTWLDQSVMPSFEGRILLIDQDVARAAGPLAAVRTSEPMDVLIAATALTHHMTLVTRNTSDFDGMALAVKNPWLADLPVMRQDS